MAAFDPATLDRWRALAIVDRDGTTVGTVAEFYLDRETGHPTWALVETGLFGASLTFVPLIHATEIEDGLQVPYEKRHIKDSPRVDPHDELTTAEEATLFAHYGVEYKPIPGSPSGQGGEPGPGLEGATPELDTATEQQPGTAPNAQEPRKAPDQFRQSREPPRARGRFPENRGPPRAQARFRRSQAPPKTRRRRPGRQTERRMRGQAPPNVNRPRSPPPAQR